MKYAQIFPNMMGVAILLFGSAFATNDAAGVASTTAGDDAADLKSTEVSSPCADADFLEVSKYMQLQQDIRQC